MSKKKVNIALKVNRITSLISEKQEIYAKLKLGSQPKQKTKTKRGSEPVFNEWFDLKWFNKNDRLVIEIMSFKNLSNNVLLATMNIDYPTGKSGHTKLQLPLPARCSHNGYLEIEIVDIALKKKNLERIPLEISHDKGKANIPIMVKGSDHFVLYQEKDGKPKKKKSKTIL